MKVHYRIDVDCANCAREVEEAIASMDDVQHVTIDFMRKRMTVEVSDEDYSRYDEIEREIIRVSKNAEPDFEMKPLNDKEEKEEDGFPWTILIGIIFVIFGIVTEYVIEFDIDSNIYRLIFAAGLLITGYDVLLKAMRNVSKGGFLDENFLMSAATISALVIGYWTESVAVMVFYKIGEYFEDRAVDRARESVRDLMGLNVSKCTVVRDGQEVEVETESVEEGEIIIIRPGEIVPIDGTIEDGDTFMDTKAMTGESVPKHFGKGDRIVSGYVNSDSVVKVRTECRYEDSSIARVLEMIETASSRKSVSEKFITRFAKYYTPIVVAAAIAIAVIPSLIDPDSWMDWVYKGIVFLVVSCPCALVISVPLSYYCGIGNASSRGILVKGSSYIETLSKADKVVFDKTGTLTTGEFTVRNVYPEIDEDEFLRLVASAERHSTHPVALSICDYAGDFDTVVTDETNVPGKGVIAYVSGKRVAVGNISLMQEEGIDIISGYDGPGTEVHAAADGRYIGRLLISDTLKESSKCAISTLKSMNIKTYMFTGDTEANASSISEELGLDNHESELLPDMKTQSLEGIMQSSEGSTVFVGDGINDAPSLARADVGIAMGNMGSDAAIEAADMVITDDDPESVAEAIRISKKTQRIVIQNIVMALAIKFAVLGLTAFTDLVNMWIAIFGDVGVLILAILNSVRSLELRAKSKESECLCDSCRSRVNR